jgi:hypothetical protein
VLCDLSSLDANVFFELGIRTSLDRPVALVKDKMTERIPFDLSAINTHTYDESLTPWTLTSEIDQLAEHVKAVDMDTESGNDLWRYFGLTKRAAPAEITENPTEAKLDLLLAEVTALNLRGTASDWRESRGRVFDGRVFKWLADIPQEAAGEDIYKHKVVRIDDRIIIETDAPISPGVRREIERRALKELGADVTILYRAVLP